MNGVFFFSNTASKEPILFSMSLYMSLLRKGKYTLESQLKSFGNSYIIRFLDMEIIQILYIIAVYV